MKKQFIYQESGVFYYAQWFYNQEIYRNTCLNEFFKISEFTDTDEFILSQQLINFLRVLRIEKKAPIILSSGYRTFSKQLDLFNNHLTDCKVSPHNYGLAVDIDCKDIYEVKKTVELIKKVTSLIKLKYRLGFEKYLKEGKTFIHFDICPEFFANNKPWHYAKHPPQWEHEIFW